MNHAIRRLLSLLLTLSFCLALLPCFALAEEPEGSIAIVGDTENLQESSGVISAPAGNELQASESGTSGDGLTWTLDEEGTLTITGTGKLRGWNSYYDPAPWYEKRESICRVFIDDGVDSIERYAISECSNMISIRFPKSLIRIDPYAVTGAPLLSEISFGGTKEDWKRLGFYYNHYQVSVSCSDGEIAAQDSSKCGDDLTWTLSEDGTLTVAGTGEMWNFESPGSGAFLAPWNEERDQILNVRIQQSVNSIGEWSFAYCPNLTEALIAEGVTRLESYAFYQCSSLTYAELPESLSSIGWEVFWECRLQEVRIPAALKEIGDWAFCGGVEHFSADEDNPYFVALDGVLYNKSFTEMIQCPISLAGDFVIPETVSSFRMGAFSRCSTLTGVVIPEGVREISNSLFMSCTALRTVSLPESATDISYMAFGNCMSLEQITIPRSVEQVSWNAFSGCGKLAEIRFEGNAPQFRDGAFRGVTATAYYPADDPSWTEEVMQSYGGTITWKQYDLQAAASGSCGENAIWELSQNGTLRILGSGEMWDWNWNSPAPWDAYRESILAVIIEEGVTNVGAFAFYDCGKLTSVTFSESLTSIGFSAFSNCSSLTCLSIPASVTSIGSMAFASCTGIEHIYVDDNNPNYKSEDDVLLTRDGSELILCSASKTGTYEIPAGVERICWAAFNDCKGLDSVRFPESLRSIESYAFWNCTGLTEITLPEGLLRIDGGAFENTNIHEVTLPSSLREITGGTGDAIFLGAPLENIDVSPDNPYFCSVDGVLFSKDQSELALFPTGRTGSYTVPEGVTSLGMKSFDGVRLTEVILPESLTRIGGNAFQFAWNLRTLRVPAGVTQIEDWAFAYSGLSEILFDGTAPQFAEGCFAGMTITAYYPKNDPSWTEDVRQNYQGEISWIPYVPGDVNEDGDLDALDLLAMRQTLVGLNEELRELFTDLDGDGEVTILDLVRLRKLLAGLAD